MNLLQDQCKMQNVHAGFPLQMHGILLPYRLAGIGRKLDEKKKPSHDCSNPETVEVREVVVARRSLRQDDQGQVQVDQLADQDKDKQERVRATIRRIPVVQEAEWKRLSMSLQQRDRDLRDIVMSSMALVDPTTDNGMDSHLPTEVVHILARPQNLELLDTYYKLRNQLRNPLNPVYSEATLCTLLGNLSAARETPLFIQVYGTALAQVPVEDRQVAPIWSQIILEQNVESYYNAVLAMHETLDPEMLLAHLFQVCFGLHVAQRAYGFVHGNLNVKSALGCTLVDPRLCLFYYWNDKYYKVNTYGRVIKITNFKQSSAAIDGRELNTSTDVNQRNNFNLDLLRLGATLQAVLRQKPIKKASDQPEQELNELLHDWVNCAVRDDPNLQGDEELVEFCSDQLESDASDWLCFMQIPTHLESQKAYPKTQADRFKRFEIPQSQVPRNAHVYGLCAKHPVTAAS